MQFELPVEFRKVCRNLGQDLAQATQSINETDANALLVKTAIIGLDKEDASVVRRYIEEMLSRNLGPDQLVKFWWATPAEIHFLEGAQVERFLRSLSERLAQPPYLEAAK